MLSVIVLATFADPILDRALDAPWFLRPRGGLSIRRRQFHLDFVSFDYLYLFHNSDEIRLAPQAAMLLVFGGSFLFVSNSIRSPGKHSSALHSFSKVAKLIPNARSFVRRQRVV